MKDLDKPVPYRLTEKGEHAIGFPACGKRAAPDDTSFPPAATAALGRSLAVIPGQKDSRQKKGQVPKKTGTQTRAAREPENGQVKMTSPEAPIQGVPAIETSTRSSYERFGGVAADRLEAAREVGPDLIHPVCMRCRQLELELEVAQKDFRTLGIPLLAQFPEMSYQQVEDFQAKLAPLSERVKVAKSALARHRKQANH